MKWIVPISGFTQSIKSGTGFDRLWKKLRTLSGPDIVVVTPQRWCAKFDHLAEFIFRHSQPDPPTVIVAAYSWGCGYGALALFKELRKRGIKVDHAVLCDPVYHSWTRPWRALIFSEGIVIPSNVREVTWFRQYQDRPRGTNLIPYDEDATLIHEPTVLSRGHVYMDDAEPFHRAVLEAAT